jgi:site-specific DNA-methyltransferase (adenine-specific)
VQCVVTSPPYFGLRDYGNAGQIGLEKTPDEYVSALCAVFDEVWRVLKKDGTLWLNLGDTYATGAGAVGRAPGGGDQGERFIRAGMINTQPNRMKLPGLKSKDLIGIPWRVAFALQAAGWYLRSDIIWAKPNPMPESVQDRPTRSHEYIFLLTKQERYYYDAKAIAEKSVTPGDRRFERTDTTQLSGRGGDESRKSTGNPTGDTRNKRDVWTIGTQPFAEAHYATFPPELIEPCILAGSRPGDFVLDPFAGSGTTAMVAEQWGRRGISIDLGYHQLQGKRMRNLQPRLMEASQ